MIAPKKTETIPKVIVEQGIGIGQLEFFLLGPYHLSPLVIVFRIIAVVPVCPDWRS
jgi:hypothetical protein